MSDDQQPVDSEARERAIAEAQALYDEGKVSLLEAVFIADALVAEYETA